MSYEKKYDRLNIAAILCWYIIGSAAAVIGYIFLTTSSSVGSLKYLWIAMLLFWLTGLVSIFNIVSKLKN